MIAVLSSIIFDSDTWSITACYESIDDRRVKMPYSITMWTLLYLQIATYSLLSTFPASS